LIEIARDDVDGMVRRAAVEALAKTLLHDDEVTSLLVERVRSDTAVDAFQAAVRALVDRSSDNARLRELLENRIKSDTSDPVRRVATRLLAELFGGFATRELLLRLASENGDPGTRSAALQGLIPLTTDNSELRDMLIERVGRDSDANLRLAAQQTLVERFPGDAKVGRLLATQARGDGDATVRRTAVLELADHFTDDGTVEILKDLATNDSAAGVRFAAADALAEHFGADTSIRAVIMAQAAKERDTIVRLAAVRILVALGGDNEVHDQLLERVRIDPDPQVIRAATGALLDLPSYRSSVCSTLRDRMDHAEYAGVRQAAIELSVAAGDPDPALEPLLFDHARNEPDPAVFKAAAVALMNRPGTEDGIKALLLQRIDSVHWQIRLPAAELLGSISDADPQIRHRLVQCARVDADIQVRRVAARVLGADFAVYPDVKALLRDLIDEPDWSLRCGALQALGATFGDDPEIRTLFVDLAHHAPDLEFRKFAGQTLTWLPGANPDQLPDVIRPDAD
jgi:hypothetical protein